MTLFHLRCDAVMWAPFLLNLHGYLLLNKAATSETDPPAAAEVPPPPKRRKRVYYFPRRKKNPSGSKHTDQFMWVVHWAHLENNWCCTCNICGSPKLSASGYEKHFEKCKLKAKSTSILTTHTHTYTSFQFCSWEPGMRKYVWHYGPTWYVHEDAWHRSRVP